MNRRRGPAEAERPQKNHCCAFLSTTDKGQNSSFSAGLSRIDFVPIVSSCARGRLTDVQAGLEIGRHAREREHGDPKQWDAPKNRICLRFPASGRSRVLTALFRLGLRFREVGNGLGLSLLKFLIFLSAA